MSAGNGGEDGKGPAKRRKPRKPTNTPNTPRGAVVRAEPVREQLDASQPTAPGLEPQPRAPNPYPRPEAIERTLEWLAQGRTLRQLCRLDPRMPPSDSIVRAWFWKADDGGELYAQYAHARDMGLEVMAEELLDVADDGRNDWMELEAARGQVKRVVDREAVARSQLRVDTRKWYLSKLAPKRYGDRLDVTSGGEKIAPQSLVLGDVVVVF